MKKYIVCLFHVSECPGHFWFWLRGVFIVGPPVLQWFHENCNISSLESTSHSYRFKPETYRVQSVQKLWFLSVFAFQRLRKPLFLNTLYLLEVSTGFWTGSCFDETPLVTHGLGRNIQVNKFSKVIGIKSHRTRDIQRVQIQRFPTTLNFKSVWNPWF